MLIGAITLFLLLLAIIDFFFPDEALTSFDDDYSEHPDTSAVTADQRSGLRDHGTNEIAVLIAGFVVVAIGVRCIVNVLRIIILGPRSLAGGGNAQVYKAVSTMDPVEDDEGDIEFSMREFDKDQTAANSDSRFT